MRGKTLDKSVRISLPDRASGAVLFALMLFLASSIGVSAQNFFDDGILNNRDDFDFAQSLAQWGYQDLAVKVTDQICEHAPDPDQKQAGKRLRCFLFQIQAQWETDFDEKAKWYQKATECYELLIAEAEKARKDEERWELKRALGELYIQQGEELTRHAEHAEESEKPEYYKRALPIFSDAYRHFDELKKENDSAGSLLEPTDTSEKEAARTKRAFVRYHAWFGVCRALYFQGVCGDKGSLDKCLRELENFLWEYQEKLGGFYAMILNGMAFYEKGKYSDAIVYFDGVLEPLQMYATVHIATIEEVTKNTAGAETGSLSAFLDQPGKWWQKSVQRYLFSVHQESLDRIQSDNYQKVLDKLDQGEVEELRRAAFKKQGYLLAQKAAVKVVEKGDQWQISDKEQKKEYTLLKGREELKVYSDFSPGIPLMEVVKILKRDYKVELIVSPDILAKKNYEYEYRSTGEVTIKGLLAQIVKENEAGIYVEQYPATTMLCLHGTYQKLRTLVRWIKFQEAVDTALSYKDFYETKFAPARLEDEEMGQAILLELGKAYVGQRRYDKAIEIGNSIAAKNTYWGFTAKKLLIRWGSINPDILTAESWYQVALGQWKADKYLEAMLGFLKVIEYAKTKEEIEQYALDAYEKLGLSYSLLDLPLEAAHCYELCARKLEKDPLYQGCKKKVKTRKGKKTIEESVDIGAKMAYLAYNSFRQSYRITKDEEDKNKSKAMRNLLTTHPQWKDSAYAKNQYFFIAQDVEQRAEDAAAKAEIDEAIRIYREAAEKYKDVPEKADLYETALVAVGKCHYSAAELGLQKPGVDEKKPETWGSDVKKDLEKARKKLEDYYNSYYPNYQKEEKDLDEEERQRKRRALSQALYYLGRINSRLGAHQAAEENWTTLYRQFPEQKEMAGLAIYFLINACMEKDKLEKNDLEKNDNLLTEMNGLIGSDEAVPASLRQYHSHCYFLVGKKYMERLEDVEKSRPLTLEDVEEYKKGCTYLWEWRCHEERLSYTNADWLGSKMMHLGDLLKQFNRPTMAEQWYGYALEVFEQCSNLAATLEDKEYVERKLALCAVEIKNWENVIQKLYPIYHRDVDRRREEHARDANVPLKNQLYLQCLMRGFIGIAETSSSLANSQELYTLLMSHGHRDFMEDIEECYRSQPGGKQMYERYVFLKETIAAIQGETLGQAQIEELKKEYEGLRKSAKDEELVKEYYDKCRYLIAEKVPQDPGDRAASLPEPQRRKQIENLAIALAYQFSSELVNKLPRNLPTHAHLFDLDIKYQEDLGKGSITDALGNEFKAREKKLSKKSTVNPHGSGWMIADERKKGKVRYYIQKEDNSLKVYLVKDVTQLYYDNPDWWEARYCQIELVARRGEPAKAKDMIEILEMQQPELGGPKYQEKFRKLKEKCQ